MDFFCLKNVSGHALTNVDIVHVLCFLLEGIRDTSVHVMLRFGSVLKRKMYN